MKVKVIELPAVSMTDVSPKGGSVRFDADESLKAKDKAVSNVYISREAAKAAGIRNLDEAVGVEVIVRVKMPKKD